MLVRVVVNCGAGSVDADSVAEQRRELDDAFQAAGADCEIAFVAGEQLEATLQEAAEARPDAVVVVGGDGTLGTAASVLADGDVPLGIIPLGTFNHFAKDLGLPLEVGEAAAAIVRGRIERVDVAEVNGRCFVNNSSVGVYPAMVGLRDRIREERGWGKVRAVPVASWRVLRRFPVRRLAISADGYRATLRTPFVFVGNNHYSFGAGGVAERETLAAGEVCVYVAKAASRLRLVLIALRTVLLGADGHTDLEEHRASEVRIEAGDHHLQVALDGEVATLRSPLAYRSRHGALQVIVPGAAEPPDGDGEADPSGHDATPRR